ncbi:Putative ribonuclease H protein At1g65750, partial [Linum perenne]
GCLSRIDRALVNGAWIGCHPEAHILHLHKLKSDHRPILLCSSLQVCSSNVKPFRFLSAWLSHPTFNFFVKNKWIAGADLPSALGALASDLKKWNKFTFGNVFRRKKRLLEVLVKAENRVAANPSEANLREEADARSRLETVLWQEEEIWIQKSRAKWVVEGDRNTKFFHLATLKRRAFNRIKRLKDENGNWVEDQASLLDMGVRFFKAIYSSESARRGRLSGFSGTISQDEKVGLCRPIDIVEVQSAIKSMGALKAPGKDGFGPVFFQRCWGTVGSSFADFVGRCFSSPHLIASINETLVTLIPKKPNPESFSDFRPISLCNVAYKTLTKCIANRIKGLMPGLTHPSQTSFVPGRHITDNIIMVQEVVHSLHLKKGKKFGMVVKIDLAKAYDKIDWGFVKDTLCSVGVPDSLVEIIMACILSPSIQILWNGGCSESFSPSRGLRQGCPLSPYLFTLCIERLSRMIISAVDFGYWKPIRLAHDGPPLSHSFFADDLILFSEASASQAQVISDILDRFCEASGQSVSKPKSRVYFSRNTPAHVSTEIVHILGISATPNLGRYLGVPILHGKVTKYTYEFLLDRLDSKLAGWKADNLSLAGRVTLASSVLNSLPCYVMQTAFLPVSLCDKIDRKFRDFIWGSTNGARKLHNVNWDTVCKPKNLGGLGLRSARELNEAFLMKVAWSFLVAPEELWVKAVSSKYLTRSEAGLKLRRKSGFSSLWRGVLRVWNMMLHGLHWSVRNGKDTKFWSDRWLDSGCVLADAALNIQEVNSSQTVSDFVLQNGSWDLNRLSLCLNPEAVLQVMGMDPPSELLGKDVFVWGLEANGRFSVKTAYLLAKEIQIDAHDGVWRKVWNWEGPAMVKHFLWLATHGRLMTNEERRRRHIAPTATCPECQGLCEDGDHVLRSCPFAHQVWRMLLPEAVERDAPRLSFFEWWSEGISRPASRLLFGVIAWLLWKRRNRLVFLNEASPLSEICGQVKFWAHLFSSSWKALQGSREAPSLARQAQLIGWRPAEEGWCSLNSDGSLYSNPSRAAAGGVIRDHDGRFVSAFAANLGVCSIMRAELRGIVEGMKLAWSLGIRKLCVQSDSKAAVQLLSNEGPSLCQHASLLQQFAELASRDWQVSLHHVYREANYAADCLANQGQSLDLGVHVFYSPDVSLQYWLRFDLYGVCTPRLISNNM